jgi:hypothetical protein
MILTPERFQRETAIFSRDKAFRYWWRDSFGQAPDVAGRALFVFLCPREGPMIPAHRATLRAIAGGYARNIGVGSLFNAMLGTADLMRLTDPAGPQADAAITAAVAWVAERFEVDAKPGLIFLCTGAPPWPVTAYQAKVDQRKAVLLDAIRRAGPAVVLRSAGPAEPGGHPPNPLHGEYPAGQARAP